MSKRNHLPRGEIAMQILGVVGVTGVLIAGAVCPGLLMLVPKSERRRYAARSYYQAYLRLDQKGLIAVTKTPKGIRVVLTKKGRKIWKDYEAGRKTIQKPKTWDGKWRLLIFDIPERRREARHLVRQWLTQLGFHRLQDSVWVHPYECAEVLQLLRTRFGVRREALYLCAEHIDNDRWLRDQYGLKSSATLRDGRHEV